MFDFDIKTFRTDFTIGPRNVLTSLKNENDLFEKDFINLDSSYCSTSSRDDDTICPEDTSFEESFELTVETDSDNETVTQPSKIYTDIDTFPENQTAIDAFQVDCCDLLRDPANSSTDVKPWEVTPKIWYVRT